MDYRLGCFLIPEAISFYLTVKEDEAVRRIKASTRSGEFDGSETAYEIHAKIRERNQTMRTRLKRVHGVDFTDQSKYDHVISTDGKSVAQVISEIMLRLYPPCSANTEM